MSSPARREVYDFGGRRLREFVASVEGRASDGCVLGDFVGADSLIAPGAEDWSEINLKHVFRHLLQAQDIGVVACTCEAVGYASDCVSNRVTCA